VIPALVARCPPSQAQHERAESRTYNIVAKNTGLCADGVGNQRFSLVDVTSEPVAYHALEPAHVSGYCLRVDPRGPQTRTASIVQFHCDGDAAEHWRWS
jgi:hypothetical protein